MTDSEIAQAQSLERMEAFGAERTALFPAATVGGKKFAALKDVVSDAKAQGEAQVSAHGAWRASSEAKRVLRVTLLRKLGVLRDTSKPLDAEKPGTSDNFRIPAREGDTAIINFARAAVTTATPLKSKLLQLELPSNFLEDLTATIDEFESASNTQTISRSNRVSATAGVKAALRRGAQLRRDLNPIVRNKCADDPAALAAWESACHVQRPSKAAKKNAPPAPKP